MKITIGTTVYTLTPVPNEVLLGAQGKIAPGKKRSLKRGWSAWALMGGEHEANISQINDIAEIATILEEKKAVFHTYVESDSVQIHNEGWVTVISARMKDKSVGGEIYLVTPVLTTPAVRSGTKRELVSPVDAIHAALVTAATERAVEENDGADELLSEKEWEKGATKRVYESVIDKVVKGLNEGLAILRSPKRGRNFPDRVQLWKGGPIFPANPEVLARDAAMARRAFLESGQHATF